MKAGELLSEQTILLDAAAADCQAAIAMLGAQMTGAGYVEPSYIEAVKQRELSFPTGMQLAAAGVAIPHATPENNVLQNGIGVLRLKQPIIFRSMENPEDEVAVELIFMLALRSSDKHLAMLQKLFAMLQSSDTVAALLSADASGVKNIMQQSLQ